MIFISSVYRHMHGVFLLNIATLPEIAGVKNEKLLISYYLLSIPVQFIGGYWVAIVITRVFNLN